MAHYVPGDQVPSHFAPAVILGSYIASLCGCVLTIELLHRRRTGVFNLRSWLDTLLCATTLALVGIWCMHFIGNRAIVLDRGEPALQLAYSPGFSTLSVFPPIIGLCIAFATAEYPFRSPTLQWFALICTGIFAGLSIVGMHYMGNLGITNYTLQYKAQYLAASIVIAIGDCLVVLVLFYTLREKWISDWRKRALCAMVLAGGVSAMHFAASTNCIYKLKSSKDVAGGRSRAVQISVASGLVGLAAMGIFTLLCLTRHRSRVLRRRSQKVMLACAMFDRDNRMLVSTEGVLPAWEITDKFNPRTFDEDFDKAHPVFHWIFRVSRNWSCINELVPRMRSHLGTNSPNGNSKVSSSTNNPGSDHEVAEDYSIIFRQRFCIAASALASSMHLPLEKIGVLYDNIIETGTLNKHTEPVSPDSGHKELDLESASEVGVFGKGQLLILTRRLNDDDAGKLLNVGFKFGSMQQVGRNLAEKMQIPLVALEAHMSSLEHYIDNLLMLQKCGTWLSCFAMIPKPHTKGFDVAVKKAAQDQLPDVQLLSSSPFQWQAKFLERMNEMPMPHCITFLEDRHSKDTDRGEHEQEFALVVLKAIIKLGEQLPPPWLQTARFYGKPVYAHYSQQLRNPAVSTTLYSFVICPDLHTSVESSNGLTRVPLSFFIARHQCYAGSPNHLALAQNIHKEFSPLLTSKTTRQLERAKKRSVNRLDASTLRHGNTVPRSLSMSHLSTDVKTDASWKTCEGLDKSNPYSESTPIATTPVTERDDIMGGILVNNETFVDSGSTDDLNNRASSLGVGSNMRVAVSTSKPEDTFVDELCTVTRASIPSKAGR